MMKARQIWAFGTGCMLVLPSMPAWSAAFALQEQSASRLGTAFAGAASAADDLSTMFYNVAGLGYVDKPGLLVVASAIDLGTKFDNDASIAALAQPLGVEGGDAGGWSFVPSLYAAMPLNEALAIGLAVNVPFGLITDWDDDWMGRFQARRSEIQTINVAPSIALRPNKQWSIGAGINYQRIDAKLANSVNYTAALFQAVFQSVLTNTGSATAANAAASTVAGQNAGLEGSTRLKGDDEAWGFNVGVLFEPVEGTRVGLSYRSKYKYDVKGHVSFGTAPIASTVQGQAIIAQLSAPGAPLSRQSVSVDLTLPEVAFASVTQKVGPAFTVMADASWQRWSRIQELRVVNSAGSTISLTPERWDDTWRFNVGGEWEMSQQWLFRAGVAYDQSAVPDSTRTPRLPDSDRYWVAVGAQWRPTDAVTIDAGYAHLFAKKGPSEQQTRTASEIAGSGALIGDYKAAINILSVQLGYRF